MSTPPALEKLIDRLCEASVRDFSSPYEGIDWPAQLGNEAWCFTPEMVSLHGTPTWDALDEAARRRVAFFEAVNFFSLNIHGERALVEGLARRLYRKGDALGTRYLHHFLDEENKHMVYFGAFCERYAGRVYPDRKIALDRQYEEGEEDFLFFAKVLFFEEIVDVYNKRMANDERLHPVVREINRLHHRDESRHLAYGRRIVLELHAACAPLWSDATREDVRAYLGEFLRATWLEYYNPDVYEDAGLRAPHALQREAFDAPSARAQREQVTRSWAGPLVAAGILADGPA